MYSKGGDSHSKGFGFSGFSIQPKRTGPETQLAKSGYGMGTVGGRHFGSSSLGRKHVRNEDEYFDDDDDKHNVADDLEYLPAPGSPTLEKNKSDDESSEEDPLEAFMAGVEKEVKAISKTEKEKKAVQKEVRDDIEDEDDQESFFRYMEENPMAGVVNDDDDIVDYDDDGNPIIPDKKVIDPLPTIDHSDIDYPHFVKNFYEEHEEIAKLSPVEVDNLRTKLGIRVSGLLPPKPVCSFAHFGFDEKLTKAIQKAEYTQPTPIQAQGIPGALGGRDIIGIAKTGSGKTAAFIWPLIIHIMDQPELQPGDGPIGLICAPTRELSQQIYHEAKKFGKVYNIRVVCAYGGGSMYEQCKACEEGAEIIVATPGRLIDLVKKKATNLRRVTYLVFDEADRMFDMGFELQVRSIANHVRPDRQTLLFSATFRRRVERLARDILTDSLRIVQGDIGEANEDITQIVKILPIGPQKWQWLTGRLVEFMTIGSVLIFVTQKNNAVELATNLKLNDFKVGLLHGDMNQVERNEVITAFKKKEMPVLVATDVAARGLDILHIKTVVNYDVARDIDTHTHRIGRTGRAGEKGTAYTLVTAKDKEFSCQLVRNLEHANQTVPPELLELAMQNNWFKKNRGFQTQKGKRMNIGGKGLGFKSRPGLGSGSGGGSGGSMSGGARDASNFKNWEPSKSYGPQSERVAAMKMAFSAQFKSNFISATPEGSWKGSTGTTEYSSPHVEKHEDTAAFMPPPDKKKKQRWDV